MFVEDTRRMLDDRGIEKTDLVGFSLGGFVAQTFAARYPERTGRLVIGKTLTRYNDLIRKGKNIVKGKPFMAGYWGWCNLRPFLNQGREYGCNLPMKVANEIGKGLLDIDMTSVQMNVKAQSLIIDCKDDHVIGEPVSEIKDAKVVTLNNCGHLFYGSNKKMYKNVAEFLKRKKDD
jgi:alpha/beta superfamily hydrolase